METSLAIISIIAIVIGPIAAVYVGEYLQDRKKKYDAKMNLFLNLMAHRGDQVCRDFVRSLNLVEVVFYDCPKVLECLRKHFENLHSNGLINPVETRRSSWLELAASIAKALHYTELRQTDLERYYIPQVQVDRSLIENNTLHELYSFLQNGNEFFKLLRDETQKRSEKLSHEN